MASRRLQLEAEERFIDERGGRDWLDRYVLPFYLVWAGVGAAGAEARALRSEVRERAHELSPADISVMVCMQWRVQVMGTWYAIARADEALAGSMHRAFDACYGSLTAPALTAAVLTYANDSTAAVLRSYRDRDLDRGYGASGVIDAALRRLEASSADAPRLRDDDDLDCLLHVARQLQERA